MNDYLRLVIGAARVVELQFIDEDEQIEDLIGTSAARLTIQQDELTPPVMTKDTTDVSQGVATFDVVSGDTAGLAPGRYVGRGSIDITGKTYRTEPFAVILEY